jgi:hypothetical protein
VKEGRKGPDGYHLDVKVGKFTISDFGVGGPLLHLVGRKVTVAGSLCKNDNGSPVLNLTRYEVVED